MARMGKGRAVGCSDIADGFAVCKMPVRFVSPVFDLNQITMPPKSIKSFVTVISDPVPGWGETPGDQMVFPVRLLLHSASRSRLLCHYLWPSRSLASLCPEQRAISGE